MTILDPVDGYTRWAPTYARETAISFLEDQAVRAVAPSPVGLRLLDAGCGPARRMADAGAAHAVGVDLCPAMLAHTIASPALTLFQGDVRALPVDNGAFDLVWCRLVLGHLPDPAPAYAELARASRPGGHVVISDFHPDAHHAGHRRTFRDAQGLHEIAHWCHTVSQHTGWAAAQGLRLQHAHAATIGPQARSFYADAGRLDAYAEHFGLAVVSVLVFVHEAAPCAG